ncbi:rod shape-determining protein RodA [Patescibacteria group bacterium]|nr:rod shape-determining protein RodA [Patescibacteria group bacterium]
MWLKIKGFFIGLDVTLLLLTFLLMCIGLAEIYSSALTRPELLPFFWRQLSAAGLGLVALLVISLVDYRIYRSWSRLIYFGGLVLLVAVLLFGQTVRGTTGWFNLGYFNFQPVELVKFFWVIVLAGYLAQAGPPLTWSKTFWATVLLLPLVFLILVQPDFGSAFLLLSVWGVLLAAVPKTKQWWFVMLGLVAVVALVGSFFLKDYQRQRLSNLFNPQSDRLGSGYNVTQSVIAVGSGGLWGRGLGLGTQSQLKFLPEQHTDFIFASIAEELGLIGSLLVLTLWGAWFGRLVWLLRRLRDDFAVLLAVGIFSIFATQVTFNIGMNIGLFPVVGLTLPFLSYGGSSLIMSLAAVGILLNLFRHYGRGAPQEALPEIDRRASSLVL